MEMKVKEISVEVGEVRNHPHEFGNYRCSVRLTATVDDLQVVDDHGLAMTRELRDLARMHVVEECDQWEEQVREQHRIEEIVDRLYENVRVIRGSGITRGWAITSRDVEELAADAITLTDELPGAMRGEWRRKIAEAKQERITEIEAAEAERKP